LCDVSDSVREVSRYFLEFVHAAEELFPGTRSFVFVSDIGETTRLFRELGAARTLARIESGSVVSGADASNYGRVLARFERALRQEIDKRTSLVVLGDGRTNYHADGAEVLRRMRDRVRALYWICPEGRDRWGIGDSAMPRYAEASTVVLVARSASELEDAARRLVARS
jgi:uncharacterized protein with von Willebrand factor type A (vWA) domain